MVIVGGSTMVDSFRKARKTYLWMVQSFQITGHFPKLIRFDDLTSSFTEEDAWRLHYHNEEALVINLLIADFNTRRALVDNRSLADILYYLAF